MLYRIRRTTRHITLNCLSAQTFRATRGTRLTYLIPNRDTLTMPSSHVPLRIFDAIAGNKRCTTARRRQMPRELPAARHCGSLHTRLGSIALRLQDDNARASRAFAYDIRYQPDG
jgi:hypothetical protein